jgi:hypothetical protein
VSYAAFMPPAKTRKASVYRTSHCNERRIWALCRLFVERNRTDNRKALARGDVLSGIILGQELGIVADPTPHPRHADVVGWPDQQAQQMMKAVVLAENSSLFFRP